MCGPCSISATNFILNFLPRKSVTNLQNTEIVALSLQILLVTQPMKCWWPQKQMIQV